jgi:signal transduction histidine kinase
VAQWTDDARTEIHGLFDESNRIGAGFDFSQDFVLRAGLMLADLSSVGFKVENFTRANMERLEAVWPAVRSALVRTVELEVGAQEKAASLFGMVERQVEHLVRLVDDLFEISRITTGKITLKKETVELTQIVRQALETSEPYIRAHRHKMRFAICPEPLIVEGDPVRLAQIFTNILNNAAKYTPPSTGCPGRCPRCPTL